MIQHDGTDRHPITGGSLSNLIKNELVLAALDEMNRIADAITDGLESPDSPQLAPLLAVIHNAGYAVRKITHGDSNFSYALYPDRGREERTRPQ